MRKVKVKEIKKALAWVYGKTPTKNQQRRARRAYNRSGRNVALAVRSAR